MGCQKKVFSSNFSLKNVCLINQLLYKDFKVKNKFSMFVLSDNGRFHTRDDYPSETSYPLENSHQVDNSHAAVLIFDGQSTWLYPSDFPSMLTDF